MKKRTVSTLAINLVIGMQLMMISGCGGVSNRAEETDGAISDSIVSEENLPSVNSIEDSIVLKSSSAEEPLSSETGETDTIPEDDPSTIDLPLTDEPVTLTYLSYTSASVVSDDPHLSNNVSYKEFEALTNVKIDHILYTNENYAEQLMLFLAAGEYADIALDFLLISGYDAEVAIE